MRPNTRISGLRSKSWTCRSICIRVTRYPVAQIYDGHPWLMGPVWAFGHETAVHALRLMGSDCSMRIQAEDRPRPYGRRPALRMWRIDNANAWIKAPHNYHARKRSSDYFRNNFYLTTSGNFDTQALIDALLGMAPIGSCFPSTGLSKMSITPRVGSTPPRQRARSS